MNRPAPTTLWRLAWALVALAVADVTLTTVGVLYFGGEEGNPLIVALAERLRFGAFNHRVVIAVWLSKVSVMVGLILAVHFAVRSEPERDDKLMFVGLLSALVVYLGVIASWGWWFLIGG